MIDLPSRFRLLLTLLLLGCLSAGAARALTPVSFAPHADYATGSLPYDVAAGDLNGDGWPDLAVPTVGSSVVSVLINQGNGTFAPRVDYPAPSGCDWVAIADLNNDGKLDLAVNSAASLFSFFPGHGDGTFGARTDTPAPSSNPSAIVAEDLDGDGNRDLVIGHHYLSAVSFQKGHGDGTFDPPVYVGTGSGPDQLTMGDLDGDGRLDLVTSNRWDNNASVRLGHGDGTFGPLVNYPASGWPWGALIGDFKEDGKPDIAITNHYPDYSISLLPGNGDGTFGPQIHIPVLPGGLDRSVMADFNLDGHLDLAPVNGAMPSVLAGRGDGTFEPPVSFAAGLSPARSCVADFDRDGRTDYAVVNYGSSTVSVLLNTSGTTITPQPPGVCISTVHPCVEVPVTISRVSATPMRGYSVTLQLSANLAVCSPGIEQSNYLAGIGATNFQVLNNGGGSYTVDCAILGLPCGATAATGTLFALHLGSAAPAGVGTVTVTSVTLRDCGNAPIAGYPGTSASITIDNTPPAAATALTATQQRTGNDSDGTTRIMVSFGLPPDADSVRVYRAGYGNYPEYDDPPGAGAVPALPGAYPPGAPWTLTGVTASGQSDEVATRDVWYYVAYVKDACGNVSPVSNRSAGTLNYHLGDVANGVSDCAGNNQVTTGDVSLLGAHYGATLGPSDAYGCLDVGPTLDFTVQTRPTTDNKLGFEDLMMFAINFGQVSKPGRAGMTPESAGPDALTLAVPELPEPGHDFTVAVNMRGAGDIQGLSLDLAYDASVVTPIDVSSGELLTRQAAAAIVLSSGPGNVDVALLGAGAGLAGQGELARVTFRVLAAGHPALGFRSAVARDADNRGVPVSLNTSGATMPAVPAQTYLGHAYPNPFAAGTSIPYGVRSAASITLSVFDVSGRLVRTLLSGEPTVGARLAQWDGRDDQGRLVGSGLYLIRMSAGGDRLTRPVYVVR